MGEQQQGKHDPTIVTLPAADLVCRTGTIYNEDSENFFEEQYFGGDDLPVLPAGSADTSLQDSSLDIEKNLQKLTICQMVHATVHDDAPKPNRVRLDSYVPTKDPAKLEW